MTRIFFDANVIIAASASNKGEAHVLTRLADEREDITLLTTEYAWDEAERNLQQQIPDALPKFYDLTSYVGIVAEPSEGLVKHLASYIPRNKRPPNKDLPIIAGAIFAAADYLITHDGEHFEPLYGEKVYDVEIQRPAAVLARLQNSARGCSQLYPMPCLTAQVLNGCMPEEKNPAAAELWQQAAFRSEAKRFAEW